MKKLLLIFVFLIIGTTAYAQVLLSLIFGEKLNSEGLNSALFLRASVPIGAGKNGG